MLDFDKLGSFYLGKTFDLASGSRGDAPMLYDSKDLTTHGVIVGMTGSGKTGLGLCLLEEALIDNIPVIAVDPKGDLGNLLLTFPQLRPAGLPPVRVQYLTGRKDEAYATIALARRSVEASERPILWVNIQELDMTIRDGKNEQALKSATAFVKKDAEIRLRERAEQLSRGIDQSLEAQTTENQASIELFLLKATAESNLKKYEDAIESYDNALLMAPMASDILALRGWAKLSADDAKGAKKDFKTALKYMPDLESAKAGLKAADDSSSDSK